MNVTRASVLAGVLMTGLCLTSGLRAAEPRGIAESITGTRETVRYSAVYPPMPPVPQPAAPAIVIPRDQQVGIRYRLNRQAAGSEVIGNDAGETMFNLFWPFEANGDNRFLFLDSRVLLDDFGKGGVNLGIGYRAYSKRWNRIFTLSGWWDWDHSHHRTYEQAGISFSSLGKWFDLRANVYMPFANSFHTTRDFTDMANPYFGGNNVLVNRYLEWESSYRGFDIEVGGLLPVVGKYGTRGYIGAYHWASKTDRDTTGVKLRLETQVNDDLMIGVGVSDDDLFGTNTWMNIVLSFPDGRPSKWFRPQTMRERLTTPVRRNNRVVVNRRRRTDRLPLINASGANAGQPVEIVWVDPQATGNGDGTYETPLNTLAGYSNLPSSNFIIVGSGNLEGNITLFDDQRLLSEWMINQDQVVLDSTFGLIPLPAVDPLATIPSFSDPFGIDGNNGGGIVTLAGSNTEIGGFIFDGVTNTSGAFSNAIITAPGWTVGGFNIHDNMFFNNRNSVLLTNNASGGGANYALGLFENNVLNGNGFDSNIGFGLTATNASALNLLVRNNTVTNYRGEDLDGDGVLDPGEDVNGNGVLDPGIAFRIESTDRAVVNAVSIPGDPNDPNDPGLTLGILDNTATDNGTGLLLLVDAESVLNADVSGNTFSNNNDPNTGVSMIADGGMLNLMAFSNNVVFGNSGIGVRLLAFGDGTIASLISEDLNNNGILDAGEDANGNGRLDLGFTGNRITGNGDSGLVVVANDGTISNLFIGSPDSTLPDADPFGSDAETDANGDGFLNRGNGNGALDPGEDVNGNGILDSGEDNNEDLNNNGILDTGIDLTVGALREEDLNGDGFLNTGNGNGLLDPGEDVNGNGLLDPGEDADEDVNSNGILDGPDNVIAANGTGPGTDGHGIVLMTLASEDANGNGLLDPGEDTNNNGRLDFGGGLITGAIVNNFLDNTADLDGSGNPLLANNNGGHIVIVVDGGSSGTGLINLETIANNSVTGSVTADGISIVTTGGGTFAVNRIENNTLDHNTGTGILAVTNSGVIDLGTVDNNTINRLFGGVDAVSLTGTNAGLSATFLRNRIFADATTNLVAGDGILVASSGGTLSLVIGQDDPVFSYGNIFDGNVGAAISVALEDNGTGSLQVRRNTVLRTTDDLDLTTIVAGEAIHVLLTRNNLSVDATAVLTQSIIEGNLIGDALDPTMANIGTGVRIVATEDTTIQDLHITNNVISNSGVNGISVLRTDDARVVMVNPLPGQTRGITISDNIIDASTAIGIDLVAQNAGNTQIGIELRGNQVTNSGTEGIRLTAGQDADLFVDLNANLVDASGTDGVLLAEQTNVFESALRKIGGTWTGNTISNNLEHGVAHNARTVNLVIGIPGTNPANGSSLGNLISDNGFDGIEINGFGDVLIENNVISGNGALALADPAQGGGIDINWVDPGEPFNFAGKDFTLRGNRIEDNRGDGVEIQQGGAISGTQRMILVAENNEIRNNDGRGVDILNQDSGESFIRFGDGTSAGRNQIDSNNLEGFYVVNTASAVQNQSDLSDVDLDATGAVTAMPNLVLVLDDNSLEDNNQVGSFIGGGLVLRVGTTNSYFDYTGADDTGGNASDGNGVGTNLTLDPLLGTVVGNGRVNARIENNLFDGNNGDDVFIESFTSTVDPVDTEDTWDDTVFDVTVYEGDPLARLNLVLRNNSGGSLDVTRGESDRSAATGFSNVVGAHYFNDEDVFKSRLDSETPPGPFTSEARRRNAQRIAARDSLPPSAAISPDVGMFEYAGMGISTFRIETGFDTAETGGNFASGDGFAFDGSLVPPLPVDFSPAILFGELPFGWTEVIGGTFRFDFPTP